MRKMNDGLWVHEDRTRLGGTNLLLRSTFVKLRCGGLLVHSPTPISEELRSNLQEVGDVAFLVAPNNGHSLWFSEWCDAYPDAQRFVARGLPAKLPDLSGCTVIEDDLVAPWADEMDHLVMPGAPFFDEAVFFHRASKSLILTDLIQNHHPSDQEGFGKVISKLILGPIGFKGICIAPPLKLRFMIKDRPAFSAFIDKIKAWDFDRIILTHGAVIEVAAKEVFAGLVSRFDR